MNPPITELRPTKTSEPRWEPYQQLSPSRDFSILDVLTVLLVHRKIILVLGVLGALLAGVVSVMSPSTYTVQASFVPSTVDNSSASKLSGLAAQFGVSVPGGSGGTQTPFYYTNLLESPEILRPAVEAQYALSGKDNKATVDLIQFLKIDEGSRGANVREALKALQKILSVSANATTTIVNVRATTEDPAVSKQLVERLLNLVNTHELESRQAKAVAEGRFIEKRLTDMKEQVREAEGRLQAFLLRNRLWQGDPQLVFEHDRLRRELDMSQQIYVSLAQGYEQARMDALRNTPSIAFVEHPMEALAADEQRIFIKIALGLLAGIALGMGLAAWRELMRRLRERDEERFRQYEALRSSVFRALLSGVSRSGREVRPSER